MHALEHESGDAYFDARTRFFVLPPHFQNAVLTALRWRGEMSVGAMVASALEARRDDPKLADAFDELVRNIEDNGAMMSSPKPAIPPPSDTSIETARIDALALETIDKTPDLASDRRDYLQEHLQRPNARNALYAIAMMERDLSDRPIVWRVAAMVRGLHELQRQLVPHLREMHIAFRNNSGELKRSPVVDLLSRIEVREALDALDEMTEVERRCLRSLGIRPWDAARAAERDQERDRIFQELTDRARYLLRRTYVNGDYSGLEQEIDELNRAARLRQSREELQRIVRKRDRAAEDLAFLQWEYPDGNVASATARMRFLLDQLRVLRRQSDEQSTWKNLQRAKDRVRQTLQNQSTRSNTHGPTH